VQGGEPDQLYSSVIDGLKQLYRTKMKPLEEQYKFGDFHTPVLTDADIEAKPMVLLLGQYSTGKTTFIRYLLERDFPGQNIGPEPTTDRFNAVMWSSEERVIPGNTVAVQEDKPFRGLSKFGTGFLSKFQCSTLPAPLLEKLTFVDTPGVLSGEKQRIGGVMTFHRFANGSQNVLT
jgi:EH domain-containing protein 1